MDSAQGDKLRSLLGIRSPKLMWIPFPSLNEEAGSVIVASNVEELLEYRLNIVPTRDNVTCVRHPPFIKVYARCNKYVANINFNKQHFPASSRLETADTIWKIHT